LLKWSNEDWMKNNNNTTVPPKVPITKGPNKGASKIRVSHGKLPPELPEPEFVADPNHRKKVFTGELIGLLGAKAADRATLCRMDTTRLGVSFGYMIWSLKNMPEDEWLDAASAVLENHFDDHWYCGRWCPCKRMSAEERANSERVYMDKETSDKLYAILQEKLEFFITVDCLKEVAHGMDT
jgi:hypothetical protein